MWHTVSNHSHQSEDKTDDMEIDDLGDPPVCPVPDCNDSVTDTLLPEHILDAHPNRPLTPSNR